MGNEGFSGSPIVSIITPLLNGVKYLESCIQSILKQNLPYVEHILVDGGSTDGTVDILARYQAGYPGRIRFISEPDRGAGDAWNKGLRMARGEIFGWLGADDTSEPGALEAVIQFFNENPGAYFVFGNCNYINERDEVINRPRSKDFDLEVLIKETCYVPCPSSFYRREVIEKIGYHNALGDDLDFLIRAGKAFPIHRIEKVFSNFRIHPLSATTGTQTKIRKMWMRETCLCSRRYGGGFFSGYCRRYYKYLIIESLRPFLGFSYPFIKKIFKLDSRPLKEIVDE